MEIEYEATFIDIDKDEYRKKLEQIGAKLVRPEFLQKRVVFHLPSGHDIKGGWLRVRDESDKITMSLKIIDGDKIESQKELCLKINNFDEGIEFLLSIGCKRKAYQETKRELWMLDGVEITIDEWPFLEPYIEIEGESEKKVKSVAEKLGLDYSKAMFCSVAPIYSKKYGISEDVINNNTSDVTFSGENPFLKNIK